MLLCGSVLSFDPEIARDDASERLPSTYGASYELLD